MRPTIIIGALTVILGWSEPTSASEFTQAPWQLPSDAMYRQDPGQNSVSSVTNSILSGADELRAVSIQSESIVSALSASSKHTTLIHLLQRSKSIPLLAHIGNATLFAPTDTAWENWADTDRSSLWLGSGGLSEWLLEEDEVIASRLSEDALLEQEDVIRTMDNQNWHLRQHLLYHIFNYTLSPYDLIFNHTTEHLPNITTQTTLLFPMSAQPVLPPTPPPGAPWLPRGGEGMLGGHGQRIRIAKAGSAEGGKRGKVGVDWQGRGGSEIWNGNGWKQYNGTGLGWEGMSGARWTRSGVVVGVDAVLDMPLSIGQSFYNLSEYAPLTTS
jgi:solute carrier family 25 carnitine/acylcarnitine transporter 20/29